MTSETGLVCAFSIDASGIAHSMSLQEVGEIHDRPADGSWIWLHWDINYEGTRDWFAQYRDMQRSIAEAMCSAKSRPRFVNLDKAMLLVLRGVNLNPDGGDEEMIAIRLWYDQTIVITTRRMKLMAVDAIRQRFKSNTGPQTPAELLVDLAQGLTDRLNNKVEEVDDALENLEDENQFSSIENARNALRDVRSTSIALQRYIGPQKPALEEMLAVAPLFFDEEQTGRLRLISSRVANTIEEIGAIKDRAGAHHDDLVSAQNERMNRAMYILAVVTAIFLPLSLLTGLLGINVGGMPGEGWWPAFWIVVFLMAVLGIATYYYLRKKDFI